MEQWIAKKYLHKIQNSIKTEQWIFRSMANVFANQKQLDDNAIVVPMVITI